MGGAGGGRGDSEWAGLEGEGGGVTVSGPGWRGRGDSEWAGLEG